MGAPLLVLKGLPSGSPAAHLLLTGAAAVCPTYRFLCASHKPGSDYARKAWPVTVTITELPLNPTDEIGNP